MGWEGMNRRSKLVNIMNNLSLNSSHKSSRLGYANGSPPAIINPNTPNSLPSWITFLHCSKESWFFLLLLNSINNNFCCYDNSGFNVRHYIYYLFVFQPRFKNSFIFSTANNESPNGCNAVVMRSASYG